MFEKKGAGSVFDENLSIMRVLDEQYFKTPFYSLEASTAIVYFKGL